MEDMGSNSKRGTKSSWLGRKYEEPGGNKFTTSRNHSQLSYISLKAPANGFTKNNNNPCQLSLIWALGLKTAAVEGITQLVTNVVTFFSELPNKIAYVIGFCLGHIIKFGMDLYTWVTTDIPQFVSSIIFIFPGKLARPFTTALNKPLAAAVPLAANCVPQLTTCRSLWAVLLITWWNYRGRYGKQ